MRKQETAKVPEETRKHLSKQGVSLVEVMIALVVLGVVAASSWAAMAYAYKARLRARAQQTALIEANTLLESATALITSNTCASGDSCWLDEDFNATLSAIEMSWTLDGVTHDERIALTNNNDLVQITVTVEWADGEIKLESYKCVR